jgi:hypothetical protein
MSVESACFRAVSDPQPGIETRYVVGAMMTPSHAHFGERLRASCRVHSLPLALFEVPVVHRSISPKGTEDLRYTKSNFVQFLLERYRRPVLYLDADCVVAQPPTRIDELLARNVDFAIFNWLAEEHTESYVRADIKLQAGPVEPSARDRFYRFSHSIDLMSQTQLLASGAVQWYNNTIAAKALLAHWQAVIAASHRSADDKCLDLAYNNYPVQDPQLTAAWLDKSYARYAWWIYQRPVIDHPEFPFSGQGFEPLEELDGRPRIHKNSLQQRSVDYVFPKDCLIDTQSRTLLRRYNGTWRLVGSFEVPLWLYDRSTDAVLRAHCTSDRLGCSSG